MTISSCKKGAVQNLPFDCTDWSYITTNTTIPAGIYTVNCNVEVAQGATLTIAPGTQLYFTQAGSLTVDVGANLTAAGTASSPIIIRGSQQVQGYWQGIIINSVSLQNIFSYCTIADGGASTGNSFNADVTILGGTAAFNNCTISNSSNCGIYIIGSGSNSAYFNNFTNNTLTGNNNYPLMTRVLAASKIGTGNTFSGNTNNYIGLLSGTVTTNDTLRPWSVPYLFMQTGSDVGVTVTSGLTIAPGCNIVMGSGISLLASGTGTINAVGTAANPITFSGLQSTAGYWASVIINTQSTLNNFQYCNFSYGGGSPVNAIEINESNVGMLSTYMYVPATRNINVSNCSFSNSASSGIYVSATDGPPTVPPTYNTNIITANSFTNCSPNVQE
jgi:hypothetical protein